MINKPGISVFFHNYYGQHEDWIRLLTEKINLPFLLFYNVVGDSIYNQAEELPYASPVSDMRKMIIRRSPNQGKDIGGKMVLLDACLREGVESEFGVFLHDKRSPHTVQGKEWNDKLFRIIEPDFVQEALAQFRKHREIGIIAASEAIRNESEGGTGTYTSHNGPQLERLLTELNIGTSDHRYVAGTMFWCRLAPMLAFFRRVAPLEIRKTLENGNVLDEGEGSVTHAWERMLNWLIFDQGYTIKGI